MKNVTQQASTQNNMDSHCCHMTPKENQKKGPLLLDVSGKENIIFIENQCQSIKSPTLFKSELCILSPGSNDDQAQSHSFIQKINSLHQESYFNSPDQKKRQEEYAKQMNEFEEIPQNLNSFLELIENPHSQPFDENEVLVNQIHFLDNFYRQLIAFIYVQYILTILCLPYATVTNSLVIYYVLLILRVIDVFLQIKLQCIIEKSTQWLPKTQCLQTIQYEIGQIAGISCLMFLTHTFVVKWLITIFVLLCFLPKIKTQEFSLKLEFGLGDGQFSVLLPIFRLCVYIHLLTCIWYGLIDENDNNSDYWDSLITVVSIISFNNQTTVTQQHQKLCFTFISFSGLFILAYIVHQTKEFMGPSRQDLSQHQQVFSKLPVQLKIQIAQYCNHHASKDYKNKKLILPSSITSKITFFQGYTMLKCCFPQYEESTLAKCLDLCEEIEVQTEEKLLKEGQVDDCSIYLILQGKVKIVDRQKQMVFSRKEAGQCFGEYAFYTQRPRSATVISDGYCKLLKLSRVDFLSCLSWKDKQFFQVEYEQMSFSNYYKWECYCCNSHRHTINKCPQLTYRPQRLKVLTQYIKESVNKRLNVRRGRIVKHDSAWIMREQIKVNENKMQYLHNEFYTPTSGLNSNCQLPYDENQRESVANQSSFQCDNQSFNQQLEKQEKKIEKVERNDHSQQTQITAGFGHQFPSKILVDSKQEIVNEIESLEAIDQQDLHKHEKSIAQSQMSNSPDCIETWAQQRGNQQNQKYRNMIRSLRSKSSKKQSTGTKSNLLSNFTPFSMFENFNEDSFDQVYNFQFYRTQSNLEHILQILVNQNQ